jgi:hypothetical protein
MRLAGRPFTGTSKITDIHDAICAEAGNSTWVSEFVPAADRPHRRFLEELLWIFHCAGMCCAVAGAYAIYMAGGFSNSYDIAIYVAYPLLINSDIANTILCITNLAIEDVDVQFSIRDFHFELSTSPVFYPGQYLVYTVQRGDVTKLIKIYCIDSVYPCGPRSKLDFVNYIWDSFSHYFIKHAITVGPGSPREKIMFLKHYRASSNGTFSRSCRACEGMFEGIYVVQPKSSRNLNAARKPLVVQLWASRYRELYPL